jgi:hypothetical protein
MARKKYRVTLTETERERRTAIVNRGKHSAQKRKRAQALLLAGRGYTDEEKSGTGRYAPARDRREPAAVCRGRGNP